MRDQKAILALLSGIGLAALGFIFSSSKYISRSILDTLEGMAVFGVISYRFVLGIAVCLVLYSAYLYLTGQGRNPS